GQLQGNRRHRASPHPLRERAAPLWTQLILHVLLSLTEVDDSLRLLLGEVGRDACRVLPRRQLELVFLGARPWGRDGSAPAYAWVEGMAHGPHLSSLFLTGK